ncbi:ATP-binding cassette domain-containing protein [Corynebacterium poyangense]|uniref:ATP-binding cassette domain-containing protein n=1 Tax=Corynebacterium poyangense TaxID=2684405 RepID=A0A7H0SMC4_9CORY|nr:metal ABC transporter ATP-binding protein [Corynebacterium poyangense]MBZ8176800.1 ATP-binding cassette domain-containing protein [Corynebacterium poyangense]QNQ89699.1 ATP-binding cassette domain-containing protein [Corynebacterium poyangense]
MSSPALLFDDVDLSYGRSPVLTGITLSVDPGQALALIGPNGAGKTTLLRSILGTVRCTHGHIRVLGKPVNKVPAGRIGSVPQSADLDLSFPVRVHQVVEMGLYAELGWLGRLRKGHRQRVTEALSRVDLADRATHRFGHLSGGQRQRALLARSIVAHADLILLDEPFNGLDGPNRRALVDTLRSLKQEGVAVVVSTHDMVLAEEVCESTVLLAGRQLAWGPTKAVLADEVFRQAYGRTYVG